MSAPNGFTEIVKAYGDPRDYLGGDGVMSPAEAIHWETHLGLVLVSFPEPLQLAWGKPGQMGHALRCHPAVADSFRGAFRTLYSESLWPHLHTFGGGFVVRQMRGAGEKFSTHSWGIAADFDVANNQLGEAPRMNPAIVRVFQSFGFTWGGDFRRPDGMHVQMARGY